MLVATTFPITAVLPAQGTPSAANPSKPNIVFILAYDLGYGDVGCYNPPAKALTPNFDRLAKEGMRFTDAQSPSTVCTPTRYGILALGDLQHAGRHGRVLSAGSQTIVMYSRPRRTLVSSIVNCRTVSFLFDLRDPVAFLKHRHALD